MCIYLSSKLSWQKYTTYVSQGRKSSWTYGVFSFKVQKWFGISSVQFSSLVTSLAGKFVQFSSRHGGQVPPFSSVQFISQSFPQGCGAGAAGAGTFQPELEPSEHFAPSRSRSRLKNVSAPAPKERKKHKMFNVKKQNPSYSLLSSSHSHGLASLSDLSGRAHCLGVAPPHLPGHIGQWYHTTVAAQWLDHVAPGQVGVSRT